MEARIIAVESLPIEGFVGIGPQARLVLNDAGSDLMAPSSRLIYSTLFRTLETSAKLDPLLGDSKRWMEMTDSTAAVAPGTTISFDVEQPAAATDQSKRQHVSVEIFRTAGDDGYQFAIVSDDRVPLPTTRPAISPDSPAPAARPTTTPAVTKLVRETIVVPRPAVAGQDRFILALPMDFASSPAAGIVIDVTLDTKPGGDVAKQLKADIDISAARAATRLKPAATSSDDLLMTATLDSFATAGDAPRAMLVYLAQQSAAKLTEAVTLVAEDKVLSLIAKGIREKLPQLPARDRPTVAWLLDRVTIQTVASIKDEESARSLSAVQGALETYAGEAGRQLDLLQSLANESANSVDLDHRLIAEHLTFLEDNSPAARVRAFDWLHSRGAAPANYDPLASAKARRAALEQFNDAATTQP